jgi:hypothetical protein
VWCAIVSSARLALEDEFRPANPKDPQPLYRQQMASGNSVLQALQNDPQKDYQEANPSLSSTLQSAWCEGRGIAQCNVFTSCWPLPKDDLQHHIKAGLKQLEDRTFGWISIS